MSWGMLEMFLRAVSKPDIYIFFPCIFVEGHGKGAVVCDLNCCYQ